MEYEEVKIPVADAEELLQDIVVKAITEFIS